MDHSAPPSPFQNLSGVLRTLMAGVAAWGGRALLSSTLTVLLWGRVSRALGQMERLAARFAAGRLRSAWPRRVPAVRSGDRRPRVGRKWVFPGRFGWLVRAASWQAAGSACQLRAVLATPEMVALLTASPQAGRILGPVCRALGIERSVLRPGVAVADADLGVVGRGRAPHPTAPARLKKRVRKKIDWGRIPLPRGVLSAVRRAGFGKVPRD